MADISLELMNKIFKRKETPVIECDVCKRKHPADLCCAEYDAMSAAARDKLTKE